MDKHTNSSRQLLALFFTFSFACLAAFLWWQNQGVNANNEALQQKLAKMKYEWRKWLVAIPCEKRDPLRKIYSVPGQGRFCLEKKGYDLIKTALKAGKKWEPELHPYFQKHIVKGSTVVDIGGHIGTHTLVLSRIVGPAGQVHVFEPVTKTYQELLVNLDLNQIKNVRAHFAAIGDKHMRISMNPPNSNNEGFTLIGKGGNRVELRALDSFQLKRVSFMKIDVEGFEYAVLQGAKQTIKQNKPVMLIEMWHSTPKHKAQMKKTKALLKSMGYHSIKHIHADNFLAIPTRTPAPAPKK
jgi:FkbM family methyltransferase